MSRAAVACPACGSNRREFTCTACINKIVVYGEQRAQLDQLRQQRNALLDRLERQLADRANNQQQQIRRWQLLQELKAAQAHAKNAKEALCKAEQQVAQLCSSNSVRRRTLEHLNQQTAAARTEVLGNTLPTVLRYQTLTLSHVSAMLAREQRHRLRELFEVFPLRINAVRNSGGPIQITVCNLRLPEGGTPPAGGWPEPQSTSAALGYLLLLVDKVALIMGGPLLHESAYQASTSSVWQPSSFWMRQPVNAAAVLPLHVMATSNIAGSSSSQAAYNSASGRFFWGLQLLESGAAGPRSSNTTASITAAAATAAASAAAAAASAAYTYATRNDGPLAPAAAAYRQLGSNSAAPLPNTSHHSTRPPVAGSAAVSQPRSANAADTPTNSGSQTARGSSRREADFKAAWDLLQRSLACFLKDKAAKNGMQLPSTWNPLAWLVVYCAVVKRDARQDGKLVAVASHRTMGDAATAGLDYPPEHDVDSSCFRSMAVPAGTGGSSAWLGHGLEEEEEEEEDEGWGVVKTILPPPPSQPDEVEHWTRAMYVDGNALAGAMGHQHSSPQTGGYGLGLGLGLPRGLTAAGYGAVGGTGAGLGSSPGSSASGGILPVERVRSLFSK